MKRLVLVLGGLAGLLLIAALAAPFLIDVNQYRPRLEAELTGALARQVKLGALRLSLFSGSAGAVDLAIADDPAFTKNPFVSAREVKIAVDLKALIVERRLHVVGIELDDPEINLIQSASSDWNFSSLGGKTVANTGASAGGSGLPEFSVALLRITNGRITLRQAGGSEQVLEKVSLEVRDFAPQSAFPFSVSAAVRGGGDLKLDGKAGLISTQDAAATPFEATLNLAKLDSVRSGFVREATGLAGLLSIDTKVSSDGRVIGVDGGITAEQLKLAKNGTPAAKSVGFDFALKHDTRSHSGTLSKGGVRIGRARASLTGTYKVDGANTMVGLKFAAPGMEVNELAAMLPTLGIVLPNGSKLESGTAAANVTVEGPTTALVSTGSFAVKKTRLVGFDLGSRMKTVARLAGVKIGPDTEFENISANINRNNSGIAVQDISVVAPGIGELTGAGTVSPANVLDLKMNAKLVTEGGIMALVGSRQTAVPFSIQGTSTEPKFIPDVKGIVKGLAKEKLKQTNADDAVKAATGVINLFKRKKQQ